MGGARSLSPNPFSRETWPRIPLGAPHYLDQWQRSHELCPNVETLARRTHPRSINTTVLARPLLARIIQRRLDHSQTARVARCAQHTKQLALDLYLGRRNLGAN